MSERDNHKSMDVLDRSVEAVRNAAADEPAPDRLVASTVEAIERKRVDSQRDGSAGAGLRGGPWRSVMFQIRRYGIAAALVVAAGIAVVLYSSNDSSGRVLAAALQQVREARSVRFVMRVGSGDQTMELRSTIVNGLGMRQEVAEGAVIIVRFDQNSALMLMPEQKIAQRIDMANPPGGGNLMGQNPIEQLRGLSHKDVRHTGHERIDGRATDVYIAEGPEKLGLGVEMRIWVDSETELPVRLRMTMTPPGSEQTSVVTMEAFEWDVAVDESAFSQEIPEGYTVRTMSLDLDPVAGIARALRLWADHHDGALPDVFDTSLVEAFVRSLGESAQGLGPDERREAMQAAMEFPMGVTMAQSLTAGGREFHYDGAGVRVGEAGRAIAWFKTEDGTGYHVIYADLSSRVVGAEEVPTPSR